MKQVPPSGVIAPSHRVLVRTRAYSVPEKIKVPTRKSFAHRDTLRSSQIVCGVISKTSVARL